MSPKECRHVLDGLKTGLGGDRLEMPNASGVSSSSLETLGLNAEFLPDFRSEFPDRIGARHLD